MKYSLFIAIFSLLFASCKEDEKENLTPTTTTDSLLSVSAQLSNVTTYNSSDGFIDITVTGGKKPYFFLWSNFQTTEDISNLSAGNYEVKITDSKDSVVIKKYEITQPPLEQLKISFTTKPTSSEYSNDGEITITALGGLPPYSYKWGETQTTAILKNLSSGDYFVTVSDAANQTITETISVAKSPLTDIDGNTYNIVKIGEQIWMKENLKVSHAPDGTKIECYDYDNNPENTAKYGKLYTWDVAMNFSKEEKAQGICPNGWHLPSDAEWQTLEIYLGMSASHANLANTWRGDGIGTVLKDGGTAKYDAKLAGRRNDNGSYSYIDNFEYMWTSTEYSSTQAWRRCLQIGSTQIGRWNSFSKEYGFSVRCIKND